MPKPAPAPGPNSGSSSVAAIVTYWLLAIWSGLILGVFLLIANQVKLSDVMLGVLSGLFGTQTTLLVASVSFWVGSTSGANQAQSAIANDAAGKTNALAQLAGAGPQPPAEPTSLGQPQP
jgi:hypothetical protein